MKSTTAPADAMVTAEAEDAAELRQRFTALMAAHGPALRRLAASYTYTGSDRDDLLQEIAMSLWLALPRFRGECSERTFLFRIAHNRGITHSSKRRATVSLDEEGMEPLPAHVSASIELELSKEQQWNRLLHAVHDLPIIYRQVIVLALEGLEYKEMAQVLGITENNVGVRVNRARQLLRNALEGQS